MRRFLTALTVAAATLALTATAALAAVTVDEDGFDRDCIDDPAGRFITGTVEVTADSSGTLTLTLLGKIMGQEDPLQTEVIVVDGSVDTIYEFTFENVPTEDADGDLYQSYLIQTDGLTPEQAEYAGSQPLYAAAVEVEGIQVGQNNDAPTALLVQHHVGVEVGVRALVTHHRHPGQSSRFPAHPVEDVPVAFADRRLVHRRDTCWGKDRRGVVGAAVQLR